MQDHHRRRGSGFRRSTVAGFGLLAGCGDLEGGKNLVLQSQQRLSVRAHPDFCVVRKVVSDLAGFASLK